MTDYAAVTDRIRKVPGVVLAAPVVDGQVLLQGPGGQNAGGLVRGMVPDDFRRMTAVSDHILAGTLKDFEGEDAVAIGVGLARKFGLAVGDPLTLVSPQGAATAFGTIRACAPTRWRRFSRSA